MLEELCNLPNLRQNDWIIRLSRAETTEQKMKMLMDIGRQYPQLPHHEWTSDRKVLGCQSDMFLKIELVNGLLHLSIGSDALISAGLAVLVASTFEGCSPEQVLRCPFFLPDQLGLNTLLTPGRINGLASLLRTLRGHALQLLIDQNNR